jgi:hypothetical protein
MADKCNICGDSIIARFLPMKQWKIEGPLCGKCYSKKISDHYPGEHVRVDMSKNEK